MHQIEISVRFAKDHPPMKLVESYSTWEKADTAFEHWHSLYKDPSNTIVQDVQLREVAAPRLVRSANSVAA